MPLRSRLAAAALLAALASGVVAAPAKAGLADRLTRALTSPDVSWSRTGAIAIDLSNGRSLYARNARLSLRPASNEKLAVALAALDELGAKGRIPTEVRGEGTRDGSVWRGRLVLKGYGDPTLSHADLATLAARIHAAGIRRVTGVIEGDESYWDRRRVASGWKTSFYKVECPPLYAVTVARAKVESDGGRPRCLSGPGVQRGARGGGRRGRRRDAQGNHRRRIRQADARRLTTDDVARHEDEPRERQLHRGELMKVLGARELGGGWTPAGARVVVSALRARGVPLRGVGIVDGSGLSLYDRLTARALAALLISAWNDLEVRWALHDSLPLAGVNGTLKDRLEREPAYSSVRAKTGTTEEASALSGYVRRRIVFAILQNGDPIPWSSARAGRDRFVQILAAASAPSTRFGVAQAEGPPVDASSHLRHLARTTRALSRTTLDSGRRRGVAPRRKRGSIRRLAPRMPPRRGSGRLLAAPSRASIPAPPPR